MVYDLNIEFDRQKFRAKTEYMLKKQCFVELKEKHLQRTLSQNSYLHLALSYFGTEVGMSTEQVKYDIFKRLVNKDIFEVKRTINGNECLLLRSSADLDKEEMSRAIDRFIMWSEQEAGIPIPPPSNVEALKEITKQIEMCQRYL